MKSVPFQREGTVRPDAKAPNRGLSATGRARELRHLSKPFWATLLIGAVGLLVFVSFMTRALDKNSISAAERIFAAVMSDRAERFSEITLEYGYWDESVTHLVEQLDMDWVTRTFVDYMQAELGVEGLHVIDGQGRSKLNMMHGEFVDVDLVARYGPAITTMIAGARQGPMDAPPEPVCGLIGDLGGLSFACAVRMTTYGDGGVDIGTDHVLMFARTIDAALLVEMGTRYHLPNLRLSDQEPSFWQASRPALSVEGARIGTFIWEPEMAGFRMLPFLAVGVLLVYFAMLVSARFFLRRAGAVVNALEQAKNTADFNRELLAEQSRKDPLTELGNRRFLNEKLLELHAPQTSRSGFALLIADLDRFKEINDKHGHEIGDLALIHASDTLRALVRADDLVFRLGGDEFVVLFGAAERDRALEVAQRLIDRLSEPFQLDGKTCRFGVSVGVAFSRDPSELLRQADVALYAAKRGGRGQVSVYSPRLGGSGPETAQVVEA